MPGLDPRRNSSISAYLGLVTTVLDEARKAPRRVVTLQVHALTSVLGVGGRALAEYGHLAQRGEQLVARLRGGGASTAASNGSASSDGSAFSDGASSDSSASSDGTAFTDSPAASVNGSAFDAAGEAPDGPVATDAVTADAGVTGQSPLDEVGVSGAAQALSGLSSDDVEVMAEVVAETIVGELQDVVVPTGVGGTDPAVGSADPLADAGYSVDDVLDAPSAPGTAPAADAGAADVAPGPAADEPAPVVALPVTPEPVPEAAAQPGAALSHDELPLADYDHMTLGGLRGRLRVLDLTSLQQLLDYERAHADRLSITTMLSNRIAKVQAQGAPAGPSQRVGVPASAPDAPRSSQTGSRVEPATTGPKQNPPSAGVPTNPAQPR